MPQPARKIEMIPIGDLKPYEKNSRTHSEQQIEQVVASMKEWGWTNPMLVDEDGRIIAGHCRLEAAKRMGLAKCPAIRATGWTEAQKRAYVIADNKLAINAGWDLGILASEFADLMAEGFDVELTGFSGDELKAMSFGSAGRTDPDDVPEAPAEPVTVTGDTWLLGNHRLRCGNSTSADDVAALLGNVKPHLMVTDPPYGVEYSAEWRNEAMPQKNDPKRWKDGAGRATGAVVNDDRADWSEAWALFPGDVAYVWHAGVHSPTVATSLAESGFTMRALICWAKSSMVIGRGHYHHMHEPCWYAVKKGGAGHWTGDRKQTTLWQIDKPRKSETGHSTQKPVECMRRPVVNNSSPGQAVYEPFCGSGTTIIACEMERRCCLAMELHPPYVDVSIERWQNFTGEDAVHEETGKTFAEMRDARAQAD